MSCLPLHRCPLLPFLPLPLPTLIGKACLDCPRSPWLASLCPVLPNPAHAMVLVEPSGALMQVMVNEEVDPTLVIKRLKQEIRDLKDEIR